MATENTTEKTLGILLPCPCCGEAGASIQLSLSDGDSMRCLDCDGEFTLASIREILARWPVVVKWIESMPSSEE
jgi:hypothetical protein